MQVNTLVNGEVIPKRINGGLLLVIKFALNGKEYKQLVLIPEDSFGKTELTVNMAAHLLCIAVAESVARLLIESLNKLYPVEGFKDYIADSPLSPITEEEIKNLMVLS